MTPTHPEPVYEILTFFRDSSSDFRGHTIRGQGSIISLPQHLHNWMPYCQQEGLVACNCGTCSLSGLGEYALEQRNNQKADSQARSLDSGLNKAVKHQLSLDARAVAVFVEHPDWTKRRIAEHLDVNPRSLTPKRCRKLAAAIAVHKAKPTMIRGSKDSHGNLEAWEE